MSSLNLNKVVLAGRLTATPEAKQTPQGVSVTTFNLAVNRRYTREAEPQADFISCVAWRQTADFITKYFRRGSALCITGSIQTRSWEDPKGGGKRYATEILVDEAYFVDAKGDTEGENQPAPASYIPSAYLAPTSPAAAPAAPQFKAQSKDDDLPF